ncbi:M16 family metallopeptidase [Xylophilus sp. ASV27]|uniref:M16 family metallopeptidase n=1 Tax=Xylophilus sp. ASV27 TaxID=2795129 RepID=UPI0018ECFC22|nr:pitrilysin family protein [Xylophilus sp. ASV27]
MKRAIPPLGLLLGLFGALSATAQPAQAGDPPPASGALHLPGDAGATKAQQFTLANGLTVIVKPDRRAPTAVQMVWVRVGSMDEVDGTSGVAHMLEHMMFKGTPSVPAGEFSRRVAALGGRENAFTTRDYTGYYQQIPASRLEEVMQLEADRFAHNQWPDAEFTKERQVVTEERRMRTEDNPRAQMGEVLNAQVWLASPYRRPVIGWMSDIAAYTADDVRAFHQRWYVPANAALVVAGDVDPAQVLRWAEATYGRIPARAVPARKPQVEPVQAGIRRVDFKAPAEQAYVALSFKVPGLESLAADAPQADDALALTVLSAVLDGYSGARLDRALTQGPDRVADSVGAYHSLVARGPKTFMLYGVPAQGRTAAQVESALRAQVAKVAAEGVSEAELRRVKTQWVAGEVFKRDSVFEQANELGSNWIMGFPTDADEQVIARLEKVTAQQVQAVAQRYFGDDQLTVGTLVPQPLDPSQARRPAQADVPGAAVH